MVSVYVKTANRNKWLFWAKAADWERGIDVAKKALKLEMITEGKVKKGKDIIMVAK